MKRLLLFILAIAFFNISALADISQTEAQQKLTALEKSFAGKIGVYALDTNSNQVIAYRADERFPVQSTFKLIVVAALLKQSQSDKNLLQEKIHYTKNDFVSWRPITNKYLATGMTLEALAVATLNYSDNPAANLIMKKLGGPQAITDFAHSIGNKSFNVKHYEVDLNSNPNNAEDTATPKDMAISVEKLTLGNVLTPANRAQLIRWMQDNTTGYGRISAGTPIGWTVAEKTGGGFGNYGMANDIGILWSPYCKPIVLAIYTVQNQKNAKPRDDIVASATSIVMDEFAKNDPCFKELFA